MDMRLCVGVSGLGGTYMSYSLATLLKSATSGPLHACIQADIFDTSDLIAYFDRLLRGRTSDRGYGFIQCLQVSASDKINLKTSEYERASKYLIERPGGE